MRWSGQSITTEQPETLPGLARLSTLVRSVTTPEFEGITFHEVLAKSALNQVGGRSRMPFAWTINPYRGCSHACVYCFARPSHEYLEFDAGLDFDRQIVVKVNVAEVLARELARPGWQRHPVALGTNTDPYQRAEGRYRLMPGIISALAASGTPLSILSKGTLLRRDLPLLAEARRHAAVDLSMSIAIFDEELQKRIEPGTPTAAARLATITAAAELGFQPTVFLMPVLPYLTDSRQHLDHALEQIRAAGAHSVLYSALHLRPGVKPWFMQWLAAEHPRLVRGYEQLYGTGSSTPKAYRQWLAGRIRPLIRRHGLSRAEEDPATGTLRSSGSRGGGPGAGAESIRALAQRSRSSADAAQGSRLLAEELPAEAAARLQQAVQPMLF